MKLLACRAAERRHGAGFPVSMWHNRARVGARLHERKTALLSIVRATANAIVHLGGWRAAGSCANTVACGRGCDGELLSASRAT